MHIDFPIEIDIFDDSLLVTEALNRRLVSASARYVVISGRTVSSDYTNQLLSGLSQAPVLVINLNTNDIATLYKAERELRAVRPDIIMAIGGGKVSDFGKRLAYIANTPLLLVPTIIANDGLISPIAVLEDDGGSVSLPGRMPDTVFIDMSVIGRAPQRYLHAAACDLITNLSATNDWKRSSGIGSERMNHLAYQMSRMAAYQILDCRDWSPDAPTFMRQIVYGQMLSGIAMALAGSSRPCSGSEHLISHALDSLGLGMNRLHGEKVGIASRFCLHLQNFSDPHLEEFFHAFGVERILPGCEKASEQDLTKIFATARKMRPGRYTILDSFSDEELARNYLSYVAQEEDKK